MAVISAAERRGAPVLLSTSVSDNSGNSRWVAAPRRPHEIDQSTHRFHVGNDSRSIFVLTPNHADVIVDQSDAVTQNAWFRCALCAAISGEISILIQTGAVQIFSLHCDQIDRHQHGECGRVA